MPEYTGVVRDLDYVLAGRWQVILGGAGELVAVTGDPAARSLLEVSLAAQVPAQLAYVEVGGENVITRVKLNREPGPGGPVADAETADDPGAPSEAELRAEGADLATVRELANFGAPPGEGDVASRAAELAAAAAAPPTIALDIAKVIAFEQACRAAGVTYGAHPGAKVPFHGAVPGKDFKTVDCSGFVREAIFRATTPPDKNFPDGSVNQHDFIRGHGFERGTPADGTKQDGVVRMAFLRPQDSPHGIGHVTFIHNGRTVESHGGVGPDRREWTNTGWQAKTFVYVIHR
jgi:hypothetical protein